MKKTFLVSVIACFVVHPASADGADECPEGSTLDFWRGTCMTEADYSKELAKSVEGSIATCKPEIELRVIPFDMYVEEEMIYYGTILSSKGKKYAVIMDQRHAIEAAGC